MSRQTLLSLALALAVAGLAPTPAFADLTLTVAKYDSPTFSNGASFVAGGGTQTINLTPGQTQDVTLDTSLSLTLSFSPGTYTGTVTSDITLDGITKTISYNYTDTTTFTQNRGSFSLAWTGGPAVVFELGNNVEVTVLPLNSSDRREATFLETGGSAVPEPSSAVLAIIGTGSVAASGLVRRRRALRRPAGAGHTGPTV